MLHGRFSKGSQSCASVSCASSTRSMCSWLFSPFTRKALGAWTSTGCPCRLAVTSTTIWTRFMALANKKKTFQQGDCIVFFGSRCGSEQGGVCTGVPGFVVFLGFLVDF